MRLRMVSVFTHQVLTMFREINEQIARVEYIHSNPDSVQSNRQLPRSNFPLARPEDYLQGDTQPLRKEE